MWKTSNCISQGIQGRCPVFKRSPSLTDQVKSHLRQRIVNAEFNAGRIPSETSLAHELKVSRNTIRDALSKLETEGIIFRKQGAGTFVNKAVLLIKTRLEDIVPYEAMIKEHGYRPSVKLDSIDEKSADLQLSTHLPLKPGERVLVVKKLFLADDKPVILNLTYIPTNLIKRPYTHNDLRAPIYQFLPQYCQQELAYYVSDVVPVIALPWLADTLELPQQNMALLSFEEIGHNQDNKAIIMACSYFRDDLLRLRLIRRQNVN
jgi:GntR family transcriptional regulator